MPTPVTQQAAYQSGPIDDFSTGPADEFAADTAGENGWSDTPNAAWASPPANSFRTPTGLPIEFRPHGENPPFEFARSRDEETRVREGVTTLDADGFEVEVRIRPGEQRWADNPRSVPAPEARPTQRMSPSTWRFLRPVFGGPLNLTGAHFSMADHRRDYEIGGMAPVASRRNTYRLEPAPWDADNIDMPPDVEPDVPSARIVAIDIPPLRNNSWRL